MSIFRVVMCAGKVDTVLKQFKKKGITLVRISEPYTPSVYTSNGKSIFREVDVRITGVLGFEYLDDLTKEGTVVRVVDVGDIERWDKEEAIIAYTIIGAVASLLAFVVLTGFMLCGS